MRNETEQPPAPTEMNLPKRVVGGAMLALGIGSAAIDLAGGGGHHLSHELILNVAERGYRASPEPIVIWAGQNWLRGRRLFEGLKFYESPQDM